MSGITEVGYPAIYGNATADFASVYGIQYLGMNRQISNPNRLTWCITACQNDQSGWSRFIEPVTPKISCESKPFPGPVVASERVEAGCIVVTVNSWNPPY